MTSSAPSALPRSSLSSLLEVRTYRRLGHAEHDGQQYVPREELEAWALKDPVDRFEKTVIEAHGITRTELDAIAARVESEVDEARAAAEASPLPSPELALAEVWGGIPTKQPWTRRTPADPHEV